MQTCDHCGARMPQLPVRIDVVRESGPIAPRRRDRERRVHEGVSVLLVRPRLRLGARGADDDLQPAADPVPRWDAAAPAEPPHGRPHRAVRRPPHRAATSGRKRSPAEAGHRLHSGTMQKFVVTGGTPLRGEVRIAGAKNAVLKLMAAAALTDEPVTLHNVPRISDVPIMRETMTRHRLRRLAPRERRHARHHRRRAGVAVRAARGGDEDARQLHPARAAPDAASGASSSRTPAATGSGGGRWTST